MPAIVCEHVTECLQWLVFNPDWLIKLSARFFSQSNKLEGFVVNQPRFQGLSYQSLRSERRVGERTWERGWLLTSPHLLVLLLTIPSHLSQVIEISGVSEHLLTECESSDKFAQCPRCKEAIPKEDLDEHFAEKSCQGNYVFSLGVSVLSV